MQVKKTKTDLLELSVQLVYMAKGCRVSPKKRKKKF